MKCINCGRELPPNARFCDKCGKPVSDEGAFSGEDKRKDVPDVPGKKRRQGSNKRKILVFILVFSLAAAGGIVYKKTGGLPDTDSADITKGDVSVNEEASSQEPKSEPAENISDGSEADATSDNDIEAEVLSIRDRCNEITANITSGQYSESVLQDETAVYCDGSQLQAAILQAEENGNIYWKWYYYSDGDLIFAYYEKEDELCFYFKDNRMIRWTYSEEALDEQEAVNHDLEQNEEYRNWETEVLAESNELKQELSAISETDFSMDHVTYVSSTSSLSEYNMTHSPERVIDGDLSTAWVEGADGQGTGEAITLYFDKQYFIHGMNICAGYQKSSSLYDKNSRPAEVLISFGNESGEVYTLQDVNGEQEIIFHQPVIADHVTLTIESVYAGSRYEDTVISEISVY